MIIFNFFKKIIKGWFQKNQIEFKDESANVGERFCTIQKRNIRLNWSDTGGLSCEEQIAQKGSCSKLDCKWAKTNRFAYTIKGGTFSGTQIINGDDISEIAINTSKAKGKDPTKPIEQYKRNEYVENNIHRNQKECSICVAVLETGVVKCPHCGSGIFSSQKTAKPKESVIITRTISSDKVYKYCTVHNIKVSITPFPQGTFSTLSCDHKYECKINCVYAMPAQVAAATYHDLYGVTLNRDGTIPIDVLKKTGAKDYTK